MTKTTTELLKEYHELGLETIISESLYLEWYGTKLVRT